MRRLGIFVFYDTRGVVDDYVNYFLEDLKKNIDELLIVCNGKLTEEGRGKLTKYAKDIIMRPNKGLDTWAYKEGLDHYGWDRLSQYDEVILLNDTVFGPVFPFSEMFEAMEKKVLDFWGITRHAKLDVQEFNSEYGYVPEHIQSYFTVFRKRFIQSPDLQRYWDELPQVDSYKDAVGKHEIVFTKHFSDLGYKWDTYVQDSYLLERNYQPLMAYPMELVRDCRCPIFKKRVFFQEYEWYRDNTLGNTALKLYEYLKENTDYPVELLVKHLLRTRNMTDLYRNFHWNYILPEDYVLPKADTEAIEKRKIGVFMSLRYPEMVKEVFRYASNLPDGTDIYVYIDEKSYEEICSEIREATMSWKTGKLNIRCFERVPVKEDLSAPRDIESEKKAKKLKKLKNEFTGFTQTENREFIREFIRWNSEKTSGYDYCLYVHDLKVTDALKQRSVGSAYFEKAMESLMGSPDYVVNILKTFEENPRLGILSMFPMNTGEYFYFYGERWNIGKTYQDVKRLVEKYTEEIPVSYNEEPFTVNGCFFWYRRESLKGLSKIRDEDRDMKSDVLERILSYFAQTEGFYSGKAAGRKIAELDLTNHDYNMNYVSKMIREKEIQKELYENSFSWRITSPVRATVKFMERIMKKEMNHDHRRNKEEA